MAAAPQWPQRFESSAVPHTTHPLEPDSVGALATRSIGPMIAAARRPFTSPPRPFGPAAHTSLPLGALIST